jgi:hypothetical protein
MALLTRRAAAEGRRLLLGDRQTSQGPRRAAWGTVVCAWAEGSRGWRSQQRWVTVTALAAGLAVVAAVVAEVVRLVACRLFQAAPPSSHALGIEFCAALVPASS